MMIFNPLDEEVYEEAQVEIGYCKLFPHLLKDFITRKDMEQIMRPANLPCTTTVNTVVSGSAGPVPVAGTGLGQGRGQTSPGYIGQTPSAGSKILEQQKEAIKNAGGTATAAALGSLAEV